MAGRAHRQTYRNAGIQAGIHTYIQRHTEAHRDIERHTYIQIHAYINTYIHTGRQAYTHTVT